MLSFSFSQTLARQGFLFFFKKKGIPFILPLPETPINADKFFSGGELSPFSLEGSSWISTSRWRCLHPQLLATV